MRIRARAIRRCGELLKQFDGRGGDRTKSDATDTFAPTQRDIAEQAGMSKRQQVTAVRVASVPAGHFHCFCSSAMVAPITISVCSGGRWMARIWRRMERALASAADDRPEQPEHTGQSAKAAGFGGGKPILPMRRQYCLWLWFLRKPVHRPDHLADRCDLEIPQRKASFLGAGRTQVEVKFRSNSTRAYLPLGN